MNINKQSQEAGEGSQLMQAGTINVYNGIDEARARAIVDEKIKDVMSTYSMEAHEIATSRIQKFADDLIPKLVKDNLLENLADPSIQLLLIEAQKSAASTEREKDYSLLSELLIHRVKKGIDRNVRSGVSRAIEIVDEISDDALLGLTVAHSLIYFLPVAPDIEDGLKILDSLFSKIIYKRLPEGNSWLDQLDVLNAIRIIPYGTMKKIASLYSEQLSGYVDVGIDKTSEDYEKAKTILRDADLPNDILADHELRDGFVRLRIININRIDLVTLHANHKININGQFFSFPITVQLSDKQKDAVKEVYSLYEKDEKLKKENIDVFMKKWDCYDNLKALREWWDAIQGSFNITSIGRVLAHANAQRCDSNLPDLN